MKVILPAVLSGLFALAVSPVLLFAMQRSLIRERYLGSSAHCTNCGNSFAWLQQVPLVAKLTGVGSCRTCNCLISRDTPWFEIALMLLLAVTGAIVGLTLELPAYLVYVAAVFAISVVDLRHYTIPNRMLYPALFLCMALMVPAAIAHDVQNYVNALLAMAGSWVFFFVFWFLSPRGLGFGDVRLAALNGFMTGYVAIGNAVLAIMLGLLFASFIGGALVIFGIKGRKDAIPFGPFLALGAVGAIFMPLLVGD